MEPPLPFSSQCIKTSTSIVHLEYDPESLPPVPSQSWTRFICISDTHARSFPVPDGDVLLHSGDLTNLGLVSEFQTTIDWICSLPHKVKIIIAGNHDLTLHRDWYDRAHGRFHRQYGKQDPAPILELLTGENARKAGLVYLQDASHEFKIRPDGRTWTVHGSPWSPYFFDWAFNYKREDGHALVAAFPKTDILLTHGPPFGIFDMTQREDYAGCEDLRARLPHLRPRLHVFGHIHEARGAHVHNWGSNPEESQLPMVQNDFNNMSDDDEDGDDEDGPSLRRNINTGGDNPEESQLPMVQNDVDMADDEVGPSLRGNINAGGDETVFVNAANWPAGGGAWRGTRRVPFGGPGFQAIVVDLRD